MSQTTAGEASPVRSAADDADRRARESSGLLAVSAATLAFSWGFIIVKALPLPGPAIATWRLAIGGGVLAAAGGLRRSAWPARKGAMAPMVVAGLAFGAHQLLFIAATQATSVAIVTLLAACQPLLVALASSRVVGERVPRALLGWSVLAVGGVALVVLANAGDASASLHGNLLALANLVVFVVYFLAAKRGRTEDVEVETFTAGTFAVGALVTVPALFFVTPALPSSVGSWALIALLALVPGNGHLLVNWAHPRVSAALSSLVLATLPVLSSIWARLVFDEPYGPVHVLGTVLVVAAVVLGQGAERRGERRAERKAERADLVA